MNHLIVLLSCLVLVNSVKLPSNFQKCDRQQSDLKECVFKAAQDGIKQLTKAYDEVNLPSLKPIKVKEVTIPARGSATFSVDQKFTNCEVYGLTNVKLLKFEFDFEKHTLELSGFFPNVSINCEYDIDGKILVVPMKGRGNSTVVYTNSSVSSFLKYEEMKKKQKTFLQFVKNDLDMHPELMMLWFDNLFNGDKTLTENTNKVLNENWKEIFEETKDDYTGVVNKIYLKLLNNFFSKVSLEEAFD